MMSAMDDAIGGVLEKLDDSKLTENTLIFFISDNGGPPVNASQQRPAARLKATTWEGGMRVPYLVQWKGKLPAGKTYDQPVIQLDIHPHRAGRGRREARRAGQARRRQPAAASAGESKDVKPPHDALYWRFGPQTAIRKGDWKLVKARGGSATGNSTTWPPTSAKAKTSPPSNPRS